MNTEKCKNCGKKAVKMYDGNSWCVFCGTLNLKSINQILIPINEENKNAEINCLDS